MARALGSLLRTEQNEAWLRVRAEFALSLLQRHDVSVETDLTHACEHAYKNLKLGETLDGGPPRAYVTEMHASLFAVGDCFGAADAEDRGRSARERLRPILTDLAEAQGPRAQGSAAPRQGRRLSADRHRAS